VGLCRLSDKHARTLLRKLTAARRLRQHGAMESARYTAADEPL
jgi:hypothetical protein